MKSVADVAGSEGNTSTDPNNKRSCARDKIAKGWCFTIFPLNESDTFDYTPKDEGILNLLLPLCTDFQESGFKICVGLEICPNTKKEHLQCYVKFDKKQRGFNKIKKYFPKAHIEVAKADANKNVRYCTKDNHVIINNFPPELINKEEEFVEKYREEITEYINKERIYKIDEQKEYIRIFVLEKMFKEKVIKIRRSGTAQNDYIRNVLYLLGIYN